ncbi:MAG TPA: DUF3079 domain-containing protein [Polyangiaceae bacterium]|nr:DUF3079 domain-containing protein [Polyangiaceae bacterium]
MPARSESRETRGGPHLPVHPSHPERVCWGCEKLCPADDLSCGNGTERQQHPVELFGEGWEEWADWKRAPAESASTAPPEKKAEEEPDE